MQILINVIIMQFASNLHDALDSIMYILEYHDFY
jgi:hypothetical protein